MSCYNGTDPGNAIRKSVFDSGLWPFLSVCHWARYSTSLFFRSLL